MNDIRTIEEALGITQNDHKPLFELQGIPVLFPDDCQRNTNGICDSSSTACDIVRPRK